MCLPPTGFFGTRRKTKAELAAEEHRNKARKILNALKKHQPKRGKKK
ncbi:hypothetical protein [Pseudomonas phage D6]|nr:hypothetical protein [Pseudomonas phage D6]